MDKNDIRNDSTAYLVCAPSNGPVVEFDTNEWSALNEFIQNNRDYFEDGTAVQQQILRKLQQLQHATSGDGGASVA